MPVASSIDTVTFIPRIATFDRISQYF